MATYSDSVLVNSATVTAAGTQDSGWIDAQSFDVVTLDMRVTNGGTGPTLPCDMIVERASASGGTNNQTLYRTSANLGNSIVTDRTFVLPLGTQYYKVTFTGNTGQSVTARAIAYTWTR